MDGPVRSLPRWESVEGLVEFANALSSSTSAGESGQTNREELVYLESSIRSGDDPLGKALSELRSSEERRLRGATFTPRVVVGAMLNWAASQVAPTRVVDAGTGSGRFLLAAARRFPQAKLVGVENDPSSAAVAEANLSVAGLSGRSQILLADYLEVDLEEIDGPTLFIGNPPYVRHHCLSTSDKRWLRHAARALGEKASGLSGLHVYFLVKTALLARSGDLGAFITSAEWLDVNYGSIVRKLLVGPLGAAGLDIIDPRIPVFSDAATTSVVLTFRPQSQVKRVAVRTVGSLEDLEPLARGVSVKRERLQTESRWSHLLRGARTLPDGWVELGDICRVHRGQVTGANDVWVAGRHSKRLPESVLYASITRAREIIESSGVIDDPTHLEKVIDLPADLDAIDAEERTAVDRFLRWAKRKGAHNTYVAKHRKAWWSVGLRTPPPILATYMARRPPCFALNRAEVRYINIAHGIYPRLPLSRPQLSNLVRALGRAKDSLGRTYAGGLVKFEPREMERIPVPDPQGLSASEHDRSA